MPKEFKTWNEGKKALEELETKGKKGGKTKEKPN
jgi:hypothetical protein